MDEGNNKPTSSTPNTKVENSKRSFVKKAGLVAGITTIAPTSVWGACNASGVSGGSQSTVTVCVVPMYVEGRSPTAWHQILNSSSGFSAHWIFAGVNQHDNLPTVDSGFWKAHNGENKATTYQHKLIKRVTSLPNFSVTALDTNGHPQTDHINVINTLSGSDGSMGTVKAHLAAVFLNQLIRQKAETNSDYSFQSNKGPVSIPMDGHVTMGVQLLLDHYYGMSAVDLDGLLNGLNSNYSSPDFSESLIREIAENGF